MVSERKSPVPQYSSTDPSSIGSFYAFILSRSDRVRLTVLARSNYESVKKDVL